MRLAALAALILLGAFAGCNRDEGRGEGEALLVSLNEARAWQRRADLHLQGGDLDAAIADVREVLKVPFPAGATEGDDARLDARARLGQLLLKRGGGGAEAEELALGELQAGQREAARDSFFRANLESVIAEVYQARAVRLSADPAAQRLARQQALAALERAIQIDKRLQQALAGTREAR